MSRLLLTGLLAAFAVPGAAAHAQVPSTPTTAPEFEGAPARPRPVPAPPVPRHPHMAANERSNLHDDAYQTDATCGPGRWA